MDIQELKAMAEGIKHNTFKELSFRVQCHLDTIDLDKFWKACQYAVNLSRKTND